MDYSISQVSLRVIALDVVLRFKNNTVFEALNFGLNRLNNKNGLFLFTFNLHLHFSFKLIFVLFTNA